MQGKLFRFGPVAIADTPGNLLNPPTASGGVNAGSSAQYIELQHLTIVNKTGSDASFSLWLGATGATAAGTEVIGTAKVVAANDSYQWFGKLRIDAADFLVGDASAAATLTIEGEGYIGVAG